MRFWYYYSFKPKFSNACDALCRFIVWHLMPRRLINWSGVRMMAEASQTKEFSSTPVSELRAMDVLRTWEVDGK